jgi:hypothetical protein
MFIKSARTKVFETLIKILKTDSVLSREVATWSVPPTLSAPNARSNTPSSGTSNLHVQLMPGLGTAQEASLHRVFLVPLVVNFEVSTFGNDAGLLLDFSEALEAALYPKDPDRRVVVERLWDALDVAGKVDVMPPVVGQIMTNTKTMEGGMGLSATGRIEVEVYIRLGK